MSANRLSAAADQFEIVSVLTAYCHALDRRDFGLLNLCFHEDCVHEHGAFKGQSRDFIRFAADFFSAMGVTHHHLSAPHIRLEGDVAHVESYFIAYQRIPEETPFPDVYAGVGVQQDLLVGGRYIDRFERRGDAWKIASRISIHDWRRLMPAADAGFYERPAEHHGELGSSGHASNNPRGP